MPGLFFTCVASLTDRLPHPVLLKIYMSLTSKAVYTDCPSRSVCTSERSCWPDILKFVSMDIVIFVPSLMGRSATEKGLLLLIDTVLAMILLLDG